MTSGLPGETRPGRGSVPPALRSPPAAGVAALALAASLIAGCGDEPAPREPSPPRPADRAETAALPAATYVTLVAWTGDGGRPAGAFWLENRTDGDGALHRRYRAWRLQGDSARRTLAVDDRLPVASASWRPLPAPGLRLSVDPRGRLAALETGGDGGVRLQIEREVATWRAATGRRHRLARGRLVPADSGAAAVPVTVVSLRFERLARDPGTAAPARTLLLSGRDGGGLLVLDEGGARPWSRGWTWDGGGRARPLAEAALPDTATGPRAWRFSVPPATAGGGAVWRISGPPSDSAAGPSRGAAPGATGGHGFRMLPAEARVREGRGARPARGFLLRSPAPGPDRGSRDGG